MKIVMNRMFCDAALSFCERCSAAYFRRPLGTDRPCIINVIDDGDDEMLHFVLLTDGRRLEFDLTDEIQEGLATEGWEFLADFEPSFFRHGAAERWRSLTKLSTAHGTA